MILILKYQRRWYLKIDSAKIYGWNTRQELFEYIRDYYQFDKEEIGVEIV